MPDDSNSVALPGSRRPDGSVRKEVRVKKDYVPPEEQATYDRFKDTTHKGVLGAETGDEATKKPRNKSKKKKEGGGDDGPPAPQLVDEAPQHVAPTAIFEAEAPAAAPGSEVEKKLKNLRKRLRAIEELEAKQAEGNSLNPDQLSKIAAKGEVLAEIEKWEGLGEVDIGKRIKNIKKKMKQIDELEEKLKNGMSLNEDQQAKIDAKSSVVEELKTLEAMVVE